MPRCRPHPAPIGFRSVEGHSMRHVRIAVILLATGSAFAQEVKQAPGAATTVPPRATPAIAEGSTGLASKYPGDVGLEKDPDVVFAESFEGTVDEICSRWDQAAGK